MLRFIKKEAPDYEDRRMIAGVLYKRLEMEWVCRWMPRLLMQNAAAPL